MTRLTFFAQLQAPRRRVRLLMIPERCNPKRHSLYNGEVKAIKDWLAKRQKMTLDPSGTLFISEQCRPLSRSMVHRLVQRYARAAGLADLNVHPHMLRHACGYDLANRGIDTRGIQGYIGHSNIQHAVRYTALLPHRFANYY